MNQHRDPSQSRREDLERAGVLVVEKGQGFLYKAGQVVCGHAAVDLLRASVDDKGVRPDEKANAELRKRGLDLERWFVPDDVPVLDLVKRLAPRAKAAESFMEVNHVLSGEPFYLGGPGGPPVRVDELKLAGRTESKGGDCALGILDTGLAEKTPPFLSATALPVGADDIDLLDEDGNRLLDTEAGHGTFIGGLVQRVRPGLVTEQQKVLNAAGLGDDFSVTVGLMQSTSPVLNLSLGGYTSGDRPPAALLRAIRALGRDRVVVAAAGNNGSCRPFWPAALPGVIAVAAYDSKAGHAASFTNYGPWVDVMAPGVDLRSVYVYGMRDDGAGQVKFEGWASWSGTSFAAPLVAAEIAARVQAEPGRSPREIADELIASLDPVPWPGLGRWYDPGVRLEE